MKRGRPSLRNQLKPEILKILEESQVPLTINSICKKLSERLNRKISWNTIRKYLFELMEFEQVQVIKTIHSKEKNKNGLTLYTIKK
jgi:repressor of nif and glnA expression